MSEFDIVKVNNEIDTICEKLCSEMRTHFVVKYGIDIDSLYEMRSLIFFIRTCLSDYNEGEIDKSDFFDATYQKLKYLVALNERVLTVERRVVGNDNREIDRTINQNR